MAHARGPLLPLEPREELDGIFPTTPLHSNSLPTETLGPPSPTLGIGPAQTVNTNTLKSTPSAPSVSQSTPIATPDPSQTASGSAPSTGSAAAGAGVSSSSPSSSTASASSSVSTAGSSGTVSSSSGNVLENSGDASGSSATPSGTEQILLSQSASSASRSVFNTATPTPGGQRSSSHPKIAPILAPILVICIIIIICAIGVSIYLRRRRRRKLQQEDSYRDAPDPPQEHDLYFQTSAHKEFGQSDSSTQRDIPQYPFIYRPPSPSLRSGRGTNAFDMGFYPTAMTSDSTISSTIPSFEPVAYPSALRPSDRRSSTGSSLTSKMASNKSLPSLPIPPMADGDLPYFRQLRDLRRAGKMQCKSMHEAEIRKMVESRDGEEAQAV